MLVSEISNPNETIPVTLGSGGANQTWDLTGLPTNGEVYTRAFLTPASTAYTSTFPTANFVFMSSFVDSTDFAVLQFVHVDNNSFTDVGNVFVTEDTTIVEETTDGFAVPLPVTMSSVWTDVSVDSMSFGTISFISRDSTINTVDGWGTVTLAIGSFDALRIRAEDYYFSDTYSSGVLISSDTTTGITYDWISKDHFILASIGSVDGETDFNFTQADYVQVTTAITTAVEADNLKSEGALSIYPNPFSTSTNIEIGFAERGSDLAIYDLLGRRVRTLPVVATGESQTVTWDGRSDSGSSVGLGVYFVRIRSGNHTESAKIVLAR